MTASSSGSGGIAATTVPNTNLDAIMDAANSVFSQSGYSVGPTNYPDSISFDKPAGGFGQAMWGSYGQSTTYRASLRMVPLSGNDYRLAVSVLVVNDADQAGFEDSRPVLGLWSAEFIPPEQDQSTGSQCGVWILMFLLPDATGTPPLGILLDPSGFHLSSR